MSRVKRTRAAAAQSRSIFFPMQKCVDLFRFPRFLNSIFEMVDPKMKIQHNEHMKNQFNWVIFKICTIVYTIYLTYIDLGLGLKLI